MRTRVLTYWSIPVVLTGLLIGCGSKPTAPEKLPTPPELVPADITSMLYPPATAPVYTGTTSGEPLVIPNCVVQYEDRQVVSAEVEGTIELFATEFKPGEYEKLTDEEKRDRVVYHPQDPNPQNPQPLKRIRESMTVDARQIVAFLDAKLVRARLEGAEKIKKSAVEARKNATTGADAARQKYETSLKLSGGQITKEVLDDLITYSRFLENLDQANTQIAKSDADFKEADVLLSRHFTRSGVSGTIRTIHRRPGEFVKAGEKIMEIEVTDKVRIEGQIAVQYVDERRRNPVRIGTKVIVEPVLPSAPLTGYTKHNQAVTGVAVVAHPDGPLVVSVGADGGARVWDPNLTEKPNRPTEPHNLPHPVGVGCVAVTPPDATSLLVVTGADDGKIRIWDVSNRDRLPETPKAELEDTHTSAVQAVAISPDGKFGASAAGRDVFVWELAPAKKLYTLALEHRDSITSVSFTPQNTLVTASKDGTIKVWKLGTERAAVVRTLDHRTGAIDVLGVSRDGGRVLFDQGKNRVDLVDLASGQTVGQIQNASSAGSFSTLAVFGTDEVPPNAKLATVLYTIATAGGDGDLKGVLQLWQAARPGGRGAEVGRLVTPDRSPITAAAFSPVRGESFLVVGTASGSVHLWKQPTGKPPTYTGRVVNIDASDRGYVTVRVELDNRELKLLDNSVANVVIP